MRRAAIGPALVLVAVVAQGPAWCEEVPPNGGGEGPKIEDELSPAQSEAIQARINRNIATLQRQGAIAPPAAISVVQNLGWPLRLATGRKNYGYADQSNFVDLSPSIGPILDYNCGTRSYNNPNGYHHAGTDFGLWPFGWLMMASSDVRIVAAAAGVIVAKDDGYDDQSCGRLGNLTANAVYIRHADGSVAWYLHMKKGSVTTKPVGASVEMGEFLGLVGSSGNSTGPHLHFELHDSADNVIEAHSGQCNTSTSSWAVQPPYYDSAINLIATQSAPPVFPACPKVETPNFSDQFQPGATVYYAIYLRELQAGQSASFTVLDPAGNTERAWTYTFPTTYTDAYYYWYYPLPSTATTGTWVFQVAYNGQVYAHRFTVGATAAAIDPQSGWWWNPNESGRGFSMERRGNNLFLSTYLYATDGTALWLVSSGALSGSTYSGTLQQYAGGQTLDGSYQAPTLLGSSGAISIAFASPTTATLTWPGGTIPIQRFDIVSGGVATGPTNDAPETGWWWSAAESGRGYFAEIQGSTLFLSTYMYNAAGQPVWYVTENTLTAPLTYQGRLLEYAGGQALTGSYRSPSLAGDRGAVVVQFTSDTDGILTLPNGRPIRLTRYRF
ncbi:MAG: peptidoglycan DD-metalloendopeptidase family protein [Proteobacteria bacterium]|nr:peptidoglycan DD-metalloendopeptidase family protein [Pseudomonadota bacterium]